MVTQQVLVSAVRRRKLAIVQPPPGWPGFGWVAPNAGPQWMAWPMPSQWEPSKDSVHTFLQPKCSFLPTVCDPCEHCATYPVAPNWPLKGPAVQSEHCKDRVHTALMLPTVSTSLNRAVCHPRHGTVAKLCTFGSEDSHVVSCKYLCKS